MHPHTHIITHAPVPPPSGTPPSPALQLKRIHPLGGISMFRLLAPVFRFLALLGLALSALAHAAALLGIDLPALVMALHAGVFVVGVPALFAARSAHAVYHGPHASWLRTGLLAGRPWWLQAFVGVLFVYAGLNFV